jgi:pimeloyl-ACP methyl ester carboxylesterase
MLRKAFLVLAVVAAMLVIAYLALINRASPIEGKQTMNMNDSWLSSGRSERLSSGDSVFVVDTGSPELPTILLLHGFPTWSIDWEPVAQRLAGKARVIAPDFIGFGYSDKPKRTYSIAMQADMVEEILAARKINIVAVAANDYGVTVVQELSRRIQSGESHLNLTSLTLLNAAIVYAQYRPTRLQRILATPIVGPFAAQFIGRDSIRKSLAAVSVRPRSDEDFNRVWTGLARNDGPQLTPRLLRFNAERDLKHVEWENALVQASQTIPVALVWGMDDPVSGAQVLQAARELYPKALVTELANVGHYPLVEVPEAVTQALLNNLSREPSRP